MKSSSPVGIRQVHPGSKSCSTLASKLLQSSPRSRSDQKRCCFPISFADSRMEEGTAVAPVLTVHCFPGIEGFSHDQSWKMSNLLHGPISTNQILPGEKRVNRDVFGTLNLQNRTYGPGFLVMNKLSINGSLSIDLIFFAHIFPKMACFC